MNLYSTRPVLARRANPLATLSLVLGVLGTAAALAIWGVQLHLTGLGWDVPFLTYAAVWANFWSQAAWWGVTLFCPVLAAISAHTGLRRVEERQDGVTGGGPAAMTGLILGYLVIHISSPCQGSRQYLPSGAYLWDRLPLRLYRQHIDRRVSRLDQGEGNQSDKQGIDGMEGGDQRDHTPGIN
jgi:hypothetical protein